MVEAPKPEVSEAGLRRPDARAGGGENVVEKVKEVDAGPPTDHEPAAGRQGRGRPTQVPAPPTKKYAAALSEVQALLDAEKVHRARGIRQ